MVLKFGGPKQSISCHDQHRQLFPNYCMNDLHNDNFQVLANSMNIAGNTAFAKMPEPLYVGEIKKGMAIS